VYIHSSVFVIGSFFPLLDSGGAFLLHYFLLSQRRRNYSILFLAGLGFVDDGDVALELTPEALACAAFRVLLALLTHEEARMVD
jgi:hypothetical protein